MARRFTREEKLNHIAIWKASGLNRKDYAASKGIKEDTFYRWICEMQSSSEIGKSFVEIRQTGVQILGEDVIRIRKAGMEIEVPLAAFEEAVRVLVAI